MRTRRSLQIAIAALLALLAAGATFAWAGVLVGGHRADHIGNFEPVAHRLIPAGAPDPAGVTATSQPKTTTASPAPTGSVTPSPSLSTASSSLSAAPTNAGSATTRHHSDGSTPPTTDDNGRERDD